VQLGRVGLGRGNARKRGEHQQGEGPGRRHRGCNLFCCGVGSRAATAVPLPGTGWRVRCNTCSVARSLIGRVATHARIRG
jgi:hypothetical protein